MFILGGTRKTPSATTGRVLGKDRSAMRRARPSPTLLKDARAFAPMAISTRISADEADPDAAPSVVVAVADQD
jgi:hypothetical protein